MAFKMKGFPQHATVSTFKQYATNSAFKQRTTSSAFKQQQMAVPGAGDLTADEKEKLKKFQEENKVVYYEGKYMPVSEMKKLEQERINRINAEPGTEGEILENRVPDAMAMKNALKELSRKYNINAPKTGIGKQLVNPKLLKKIPGLNAVLEGYNVGQGKPISEALWDSFGPGLFTGAASLFGYDESKNPLSDFSTTKESISEAWDNRPTARETEEWIKDSWLGQGVQGINNLLKYGSWD